MLLNMIFLFNDTYSVSMDMYLGLGTKKDQLFSYVINFI